MKHVQCTDGRVYVRGGKKMGGDLYGGGKTMVWDMSCFYPVNSDNSKKS